MVSDSLTKAATIHETPIMTQPKHQWAILGDEF